MAFVSSNVAPLQNPAHMLHLLLSPWGLLSENVAGRDNSDLCYASYPFACLYRDKTWDV